MSCAKTAEPIDMPFGILTQVGAKNHLLDRGSDLNRRKGTFVVE